MKADAKRLFLIDGIGALLTACLLYFAVAGFQSVFGMPTAVVEPLAIVAVVFSIYSLSCHFALTANPRPFLLIIALANSIYCVVTGALLFVYRDQLTVWGFLYFSGEILIIAALVFLEVKAAKAL